MKEKGRIKTDWAGNVTSYTFDTFWVSQEFRGYDLIAYADSYGNFWDEDWKIEFPFNLFLTKLTSNDLEIAHYQDNYGTWIIGYDESMVNETNVIELSLWYDEGIPPPVHPTPYTPNVRPPTLYRKIINYFKKYL
jgi:hypothetical protein